MTIQEIKDNLAGPLADVKLNFSSVLNDESGLNRTQIATIALSCAYMLANAKLTAALKTEFADDLDGNHDQAAQAAAAIMAMNNVYYRFVHLASDKEYQTMPAKLRMNVIGKPGIEKKDFELAALAVSALNGCGMCIDAHIKVLEKDGVSKPMIQHAARIAAMLNSVNTAMKI